MADPKFITVRFEGGFGRLRAPSGLESDHFVLAADLIVDAAVKAARTCGCAGCRQAMGNLLVAQAALSRIGEEADASPAPTIGEPMGRA